MWNQVTDDAAIKKLIDTVCMFHDSCIKEMRYVSGAYVNEQRFIHPTNELRKLCIIIQRQTTSDSVIELEFSKLKYLKLCPPDDTYICEILDSTLIFHNGYFYWCDCGGLSISDIATYEGTVVCAEALRWRTINEKLGNQDYFGAQGRTGDGSVCRPQP